MEKFIILLFFSYSINMFSQKICLDTIQYEKGKPIFKINISKTDINLYSVNFINLSSKNIYIIESDMVWNNGTTSSFEFGLDHNPLSDGKYYDVNRIKPSENITIKYNSTTKKIELVISVILKNKFIEQQKNKFYIKKYIYYKRKNTFQYNLNINGCT
jgi:hypothetical protein